MKTLEELSNQILDEGFGSGIEHSDEWLSDEILNVNTSTMSDTHINKFGIKWVVRKGDAV